MSRECVVSGTRTSDEGTLVMPTPQCVNASPDVHLTNQGISSDLDGRMTSRVEQGECGRELYALS